MYYFYIIYSSTLDRYYFGHSSNIENRLIKHHSNHKGWTGKANDWVLRYSEKFDLKSEAIKPKKQIKSWKKRLWIEILINSKL